MKRQVHRKEDDDTTQLQVRDTPLQSTHKGRDEAGTYVERAQYLVVIM